MVVINQFNCIFALLRAEIVKCCSFYRGASTKTLEDRKVLEFLYILLEVHMKMYQRWIAIVLLPSLFNAACGVVICLYIPIRHPEVSLAVNISLLLIGAIIVAVIFWASYDQVVVIRASEEVRGKLTTFQENWRESGMSELQRLRFLKRAKACRAVEVPIGSFGEFSLDVPVIMWDEILNQLLFLLSF